MTQSHPYCTKYLITLLSTGLLQACVSGGKELPVLLAREPAYSSEQKAKPIGTGGDEQVRQAPPLANAQDDPELKAQADAPIASAINDPATGSTSTAFLYVPTRVHHFERLQKIIDRDIGTYLGIDIPIVPQLLKSGLGQDYSGQLDALQDRLGKSQRAEDQQAIVKDLERLGRAAHFLVPDVCKVLLHLSKYPDWHTQRSAAFTLSALVKVVPSTACSKVLFTAAEDGDEHVRSAAISALAILAKAMPQFVPDVHKVVLQAIIDESSWAARQAAASALAVVAKAMPQLAPGIFDVLLKAMKDRKEDSYGTVPEALRTIMNFAPQLANGQGLDSLIKATSKSKMPFYDTSITEAVKALVLAAPSAHNRDKLLEAAGSSHQRTHNLALRALLALTKVAPTASHRDALLKAMNHANADIRSTANWGLNNLLSAAPQLANDCTRDAFLKATKDAEVWSQESTEMELTRMAEANPSAPYRDALLGLAKRPDTLPMLIKPLRTLVSTASSLANIHVRDVLLKTLKDSNDLTLYDAREGLCELIEVAPHLADHHMCQALLKAAEGANIHHKAAWVLMKLAEATPSIQTRDILLKGLEHSKSVVREAATQALAALIVAAPSLAHAATRTALIQALTDSEERVHDEAASALAALVKAVPSAQNREMLLKTVADKHEEVRYAGINALEELILAKSDLADDQVRDALLKLVEDKHWRVRSAAVHALGVLVEVAPQYAPILSKVLIKTAGDADEDVRHVAVVALGKLVKVAPQLGPGVYEVLCRTVVDFDKGVRCTTAKVAVDLLEGMPELADKVFEMLKKLTSDPFSSTCYDTVKVLITLSQVAPAFIPKVHTILLWIAQCKSPSRLAAVSALGDLAKHIPPALMLDTRTTLLETLADRSMYCLEDVGSALVKLSKAAPELVDGHTFATLLYTIGTCSQVPCKTATNVLEELVKITPSTQNRDVLLEALDSKYAEIRHVAVKTLQRLIEAAPSMVSSAVLDVILRTMDDDACDIRLAAVNALGALISGAPALIDSEVRDVLIQATGDAHWEVHLAATRVLEMLFEVAPTVSNCRALVKATAHTCWRIRKAAASTLGKAAIPPGANSVSYQALTKMANNKTEYEHVRDVASRALQAIAPSHAE